MKKVFSSSAEVAHIWAQQTQEEGRCRNMFFDKDYYGDGTSSIWSYGRHFEIARFITPDVVFITTKTYSATTQKHTWEVKSAVSHKTSFLVPSFINHDENVDYFIKESERLAGEIVRSRKYAESKTRQLMVMLKNAENYCHIFKKAIGKAKLKLVTAAIKRLNNPEVYKEIAKKQWEASKIARARNLALAEERMRYDLEALEKWKSGIDLPWQARSFSSSVPVALRIKEDTIETSKGARVPLDIALAMYKRLKAGQNVHGMTLENYTVTSFDGSILTVGCHKIPLAEMDRIAAQINTIEVK